MTKLDNPMSFKRLGGRARRSCVSSTPSKIPYGGFSPVRLQAGIQPQPSSGTVPNLYAARSPSVCPCSPHGHVWRGVCTGRSSPEALGSPAGYVVPPGHRLLWPHPSLSTSPAGLCIRQQVFALRPRPRGSPLYSACPSLRAASLTPADRSAASGCCLADRGSLHLLLTGSASARHASRFTRGSLTRLQSSLDAAARSFAGPAPTRAFTFELSPRGSPRRSVEYNYAGKQPIPAAGLTPAGHAALWAAAGGNGDNREFFSRCAEADYDGLRWPLCRLLTAVSGRLARCSSCPVRIR
jgi:hypothetical protein